MKPEVLAPVGSLAALQAAVRAGADAVYLGYGKFHARQGADDFEDTPLSEVVSYCHIRGVKVHLTLNVTVREEEREQALACVKEACDSGVDALIVQDLGLARLCREAAPSMPLHASTQLSCHTPAGVRELVALGFSRVVLAREMTAREIAACAGQGAELETFVHGALCMSVSGQCYLSAMLGGRSGNRGRCAQACRLPFAPAGTTGRASDTACLSLRDLSLIEHVPSLAAAGVASLKIEGRRKRPEYVAAATAAVRRAVDGLPADPDLQESLQAVFSRSGFTDSYYTGVRGNALFGVRRREDVVAAEGVLRQLRQLYHKETPRVPVTLHLEAALGKALRLTVRDEDGHCVSAEGDAPLASDRAADAERLCAQLRRTGGTPFVATRVTAAADGAFYVPAAAIHRLRREALARLERVRGEVRPLPFAAPSLALPAYSAPPKPALWARLADTAQMSDAIAQKADVVFFPLDVDRSVLRHWSVQTRVGVEVPRALFGQEEATFAALRTAREAGATVALCGNIGALPLCREAGLHPVGGFSLNLTNSDALRAYAARGLEAAVLSAELTFSQLRAAAGETPCGALVYGRMPLMLMRPCPRQAAVGCGGCAQGHGGLVDRKGTVFPLACGKGFVELLNSVPTYVADVKNEWPPLHFSLLYFTVETAAEAERIVDAYLTGAPAVGAVTRGLYRRGVE